MNEVALLVLLFALTTAGRQTTPEVRLREELFNQRNYDPLKVPVGSYTNVSLGIKFGMKLLSIAESDPVRRTFAATVLLEFEWVDHGLIWNSYDYGGITSLAVDPSVIWAPNITLLNSIDDKPEKFTAFTNTVVKQNGECRLVLASLARGYCMMDIEDFPFDQHTCSLIFGSWFQDNSQITLIPTDKVIDTSYFYEDSEWEYRSSAINKINYQLSCCSSSSFDGVEFTITVYRRFSYYNATILLPSIMNALLILIICWLPPTSKEKILLGGFILLTLILLLIHISMIIPFNGGTIPKIVHFCAAAIVLDGVSLVLSVATSCLSHFCSSSARPAPALLKKLLNSMIAKFCCLQKGILYDVSYQSNIKLDQDWLMIVTLLDRILFIIYCIAFVIMIAATFY